MGLGDKEWKAAKSDENWFDLNPQTVIVEQALESNLPSNSFSKW